MGQVENHLNLFLKPSKIKLLGELDIDVNVQCPYVVFTNQLKSCIGPEKSLEKADIDVSIVVK
ncbi:MAG: hypothetical protein IH591_09885 [Bacteroidales bacterium]|nr:hypothetical protein [Bacteroidales bacterium]